MQSIHRRPIHRRLVFPAAAILLLALGMPAHAAPPDNDAFGDALPVTVGDSGEIDTSEATTGEPEDLAAKDACGSPPFDSDAPPDATVWFLLTVDEPTLVVFSAAPPQFVTPGFNVVVEVPDGGFECVAGGPVQVGWQAEPGVDYFVQSIDDQIPPDPDAPLDTDNGGLLAYEVSAIVLEPEVCPGLSPNDPNIPPGLNRIFGTDGDDELRGTRGDDLIIGLGGDDEIDGRGGNDFIFGCDGDDEIDGGGGDDVIIGDSLDFFGDPESDSGGDDEIDAGPGADLVFGGPGDDEIAGGAGADELFGNQDDDELDGGRGDDVISGGFGEDEVDGGAGDDEVSGGFDSDVVDGGQGNDLVNGDAPAPDPFGTDTSSHVDECDGGGGNDTFERCEVILPTTSMRGTPRATTG